MSFSEKNSAFIKYWGSFKQKELKNSLFITPKAVISHFLLIIDVIWGVNNLQCSFNSFMNDP